LEYAMAIPSPRGNRWTVAALLGLTVVTGLVDAVSYLRLGRVFVANMTGNVVFLGFSVDRHSGLSPVASLIAICGFLIGAFIGGRMATGLSSRPCQWLASAIGAEAALLAIVAILAILTIPRVLPFSGRGDYATVVVLAVALGLQNSTVRHFAVPDLTTTVLSLTLTGLAADSTLVGGAGSRPHRRLGSVAAMLAGATIGAGLLQASPSGVIGLAAALAAGVAVVFGTGRNAHGTTVSTGESERAAGTSPSSQ
jgi:uncharacterized membrane protein YoaK (UPF0700 family)